jgi:hypothetical protein
MSSFKRILPLCRSYATKASIPKRLPEGRSGEAFTVNNAYIQSMFPDVDAITPEDLTVRSLEKNEPLSGRWYSISRTKTGELPIYRGYKGTGVKVPITLIRRVEGDVGQLKQDLKRELNLVNREIWIKDTSKQLVIRGDRTLEVRRLLEKYF